MPANKPPAEEISHNGASARFLRVMYLPVKYEENRKSPISVSAYAAENPKKGGDARNLGCKHVYSQGIKCAQRFFR